MKSRKFKFPFRQVRNTMFASCLALMAFNADAQVTQVASGLFGTNTSSNNFLASALTPAGGFVAAWKAGDNLTVGHWNGSAWVTSTITSSVAIGSGWNFSDDVDIKVGTDGIYHVVVRAIDNNTPCCTQERGVWYATFNPTSNTWGTFLKVQSVPGSPHGVDNPSIALDANNNPEIVYEYSYSSTPRLKEFRHAVKNGSSWSISSFASTSGDGHGDVVCPKIVIDANGKRTISYMSNTTQLAKQDFLLSFSDRSGSWVKDTIMAADGLYNYGENNDLVLFQDSIPLVGFGMNNAGIDYGIALAAKLGSSWSKTQIADSLGVAAKLSLGINSNMSYAVAFLKKNQSTAKNELWLFYYTSAGAGTELIAADANSSMGSYLAMSLNDNDEFMIVFHNQVSSTQRDVRYYTGTLPSGGGSPSPSNTAPVMSNGTLTVAEDASIMLLDSLGGMFSDADDDDPVSVRLDSMPVNGTIYQDGGYPAVQGDVYSLAQFSLMYYTPNADFNGSDNFLVSASDGTDWCATPGQVDITVTPVNDAPVLEDITMVTEEETATLLSDHATATTYTDKENDPVAAFRMTTVPSHGWLTLYGDTLAAGAIVPAYQVENVYYIPGPDYNGADSFLFNATDGTDYAAADANVNITVTPVNDGPTGITASATTVVENSAIGTVVATLSAIDADAGDSHIYQLVGGAGDEGNGFFAINGNQLVVASGINYERNTQLSVRIQVTDADGLTYQDAIVITVTDANDAPSTITLSSNTVAEQQPSGSFVGTLITADEDAADSHTLTLVSGTGDSGNGSFSIVNNVLTTAASFDYNTQQQYSIRVRSTDGANAYTEEVFTINVTDANQAPTAITLGANTIVENNAIGDLIGILSATDSDANDTHTFTLVSGSGDSGNGSFSIVNDELRAAASFDFETQDSYSIRVRATDNGGAYTETILTISIIDGMDAPTAISLTNASIDENEPTGTLVGSFSTVDPDQGSGHNYSFATGAGDTDNGSFQLSNGVLYTAAPIDFETKNSYSIRVRSTDNSGAWTEETFTVSVNDINEAPTGVTINIIGVDENSPIGTAVGNITAIDVDANDLHTFTLVPGVGAADNGKFSIQANKLQVNANLDYEAQANYAVRIRATDNGGAWVEKNITVTVTDVNEAPTGLALSATSINENEPAGSAIGSFSITDQDNGDSHTYSLVSGNGDTDNGMFYISGNSLVANASFNFEQQSSYSIRVAGTDNGGLKEEAMFTITINNVADAPVAANLTRNVYKDKVAGFTSREFNNAYSQEEGNAQHHIRIDALPSHGQLMYSGTPITVGQTILVAEFTDLSYAPNAGYLGTDVFEFSTNDGVMYSASATYTLNVVNQRVIGGVGNTLSNGSIISLNPGSTSGAGVARENGLTSVEEMPLEVTTFSNYPNPFQGSTNISFELSGEMTVTLEVYDMLGRKVASLVEGEQLNGKQIVQWNGGEANGQYIARLIATANDGKVITKTISLAQAK